MRTQMILAAAALAGAALLAPSGHAVEQSGYSVADLLRPCIEGDSNARWGEAAETECEQYIRGFTDLYLLLTDGGKVAGTCLPATGNRADEIRWSFIRWAHRNFDERHMPAVDGLLAVVRLEFKCP